jgi:hypothetical protein
MNTSRRFMMHDAHCPARPSRWRVAAMALLLTLAMMGSAHADVFESWTVKPYDGDRARAIKMLNEAGAIQETHGAEAELWLEEVHGDALIQVLRFTNMEAWGRYKDAIAASPKWQRWAAKNGKYLAVSRVRTELMTHVSQPTGPTSILDGVVAGHVSAWRALPGKATKMQKDLEKAATLTRKHGLVVHMYRDGASPVQNMVVGARSYTQLTRRLARRAADPLWQRFASGALSNPTAELTGQAYVRRLTPVKRRVIARPKPAPKPKVVVVNQPTPQPKVIVVNPPAAKPRPAAQRGKVWISGHYAWSAGKNTYDWVPGRFKKIRGSKRWVPGHYTVQIRGKYKVKVWTPGHWR